MPIDPPSGYLVLDASTKAPTVGVLRSTNWESIATGTGDALETLFRLTERALTESGRELPELDGVLFCAGPGTLLGLRLAAMAVSTWSTLPGLAHWTVRQYHSLALVAATRQLAGESDFHLLSPFRRDQCNHLQVAHGVPGCLDILAHEAIAELTGPRYFVPNGTLRTHPPGGVTIVEYSLEALPQVLRQFPERFQPVPQPEVYVPEVPSFAPWSADRHR